MRFEPPGANDICIEITHVAGSLCLRRIVERIMMITAGRDRQDKSEMNTRAA